MDEVDQIGKAFGRREGMSDSVRRDAFGGVFRLGDGCRRGGLCLVAPSAGRRAYPVGSGPAFAQGSGATLPDGDRSRTTDHHGRIDTRDGCALGDGRRLAMSWPRSRDRRDMGQPCQGGFHRDQTAGHAVGSGEGSVLACPPRRLARSERGAGQVADRVIAFGSASARREITGRAAVVARSFPVAGDETGAMGGQL